MTQWLFSVWLRAIGTFVLITCSGITLRADIFTGAGFSLVDAVSTQPLGRGRAFGDIVIQNNSGMVQLINSVTLTALTHTHMGDLRIDLTHRETGRSVILTSPPDYTTNFNGNYTFLVNDSLPTIDIAANGLGDVDLLGGQYAISEFGGGGGIFGPRTNFNTFIGIPIEGTWRLQVVDFFPGDTGSLGSWSINTTIVAVPEPSSLTFLGMILSVPFLHYRWKQFASKYTLLASKRAN